MSDGRASSVAQSSSIPVLLPALDDELAVDPHFARLVERFLRSPAYSRSFCVDLIDLACQRKARSWSLRRLAVLMLEHQVLKVCVDDLEEVIFLLEKLGLISSTANAGDGRIGARFRQLRRRLERLNRVHAGIAGIDTSRDALSDFIEASRSDCKLTLARYLFTPEEVVERIVNQLETSKGLSDVRGLDQPCVRPEIARCFDHLPSFEAAILSALCRRSTIYWVSDATSLRHNSLVEHPLGTVVVVIKPPGSDLEIEVKRVGLRNAHPWHVVFARDGCEVPPTHRLQGGSMAHWARWEAASAAGLARVYRLIHGVDPPISRTVALSTIYGVPVNGGERHIVDYFTRLNAPSGRDETRLAMRRSVDAYCREMRTRALPSYSDVELSAQFLGQVAPTQAILVKTSSFRLDRLVACLSDDGADRYFAQISEATPTRAEARTFADEILEEVLGLVTPRDTPFETHAQYIESAFADHDNRARAERQYRRVMRQIGSFWGTLLGIRSHTFGESFVARNVGLKSVWEDGEWTVKIIFMDHDGTFLSGQRARDFHPMSALPAMVGDDMHIWGRKSLKGATELLRTLYRIDEQTEYEAHSALRDELCRAFRRARRAIAEDPQVQGCFAQEFVERFADWDEMVVGYLSLPDEPAAREAWQARTSQRLEDKGYPGNLRREYLRAVSEYRSFLEKYAFLY
jgi:hypothetical protein